MKRALITGSGGLIGSTCARLLLERGWEVTGIDNDMRAQFFGSEGSTVRQIRAFSPNKHYRHFWIDITARKSIRDLISQTRPNLVIHAAAQPAHDKAAEIPYEDFDVNAVGTLNMLVAARDFCPQAPFIFTSTSKVYGDGPNRLPLVERERRYDYADIDGIPETFPIDQCLHSIFGASKLAADIMAQEFGRYFKMPVGIFRGACLTGPQHAAVPLHGALNYLVKCAVLGIPYTIIGYKGKQVRDQIHAEDCFDLFMEFYESPKPGEVYNLGAGRTNSISILETIDVLGSMGYRLDYRIEEKPRIGDHIVYISDLTKVHGAFPNWHPKHSVTEMIHEIAEHYEAIRHNSGAK